MKKLILISALLFSFNGWAEEIYLECEQAGLSGHNTAWINQSCQITKKIKNYYEIKDGSWKVTYRKGTTDSIPRKNGQLCDGRTEPFNVLIARAKETGKAIYWTTRISRENFLEEYGSELMEEFPSQEAVTFTDSEIILKSVTGKLMGKPIMQASLFASIDRLTGEESGNWGRGASCSAITKEKYKEVTEHWDKSVKEILKIEKDFLNKNRKF